MVNKNEKLLYQVNKFSYNLLLICIFLNTYYLITTLNNIAVGVGVGVVIITNIIYTLLAFLCAVKVKTYNGLWSKVCILMGIVQIIKLLTIPPEITGSTLNLIMLLLILSGLFYIVAALVSLNKIRIRSTLDHSNVDSIAS